MKIRIRHKDTEIEIDESIDPGFASAYSTSGPTKIRFEDHHPYLLRTIEAMTAAILRIREGEPTETTRP